MFLQYYIVHNSTQYACTPLNAGELQIRHTLIKDEIKNDYDRNLSQSIVFKDADYQLLKTIEANHFCDKLYLKAQITCDGVNYNDFIKQPFYITNVEFRDSRCMAVVNLDNDEVCTNLDVQYNLFDSIATRHNVAIIEPNITIESVTYTSSQSYSYDHNYAWGGTGTPASNYYSVKHHVFAWNEATQTGTNTTTWVREILTVPCTYTPNNTWTLLTDNCPTDKIYTRFASLTNCKYETVRQTNGDFITTDNCDTFEDAQNTSNTTVIPNGITLQSALNFFASNACNVNSVRSNFFQINPTVTTNINYVTGVASKVLNIMLFDLSDVKRPNAAQKATALNLSFEKLMQILKGMFDVEYRIEGTVLVIEHVSYFSKTVIIDTTQTQYFNYVRGKNNYRYTGLSVPRFEAWQYQVSRYNSDFRKAQFDYNSCVTTTDGRTTTIEAVTDLILCLNNPEIDSNIVSDDGVFIGACGIDNNNDYYFLTELNSIGTVGIDPNNVLGIPQILRDYHKHKRPFLYGTFFGQSITFQDVRIKEGDTIEIQLTCEQIKNFTPNGLIKTEIGDGEIEESNIHLFTGKAQFKLKY